MNHRGVTILLTLTLLTLWAMAFSVEAQAAPGSVSGRVTDAVTHAGVADIQVYASLMDQGGPPTGGAVTAADGTYVMSGLTPGAYIVRFNDQDGGTNGAYADEYYDDNVCQDFGDPVVVGDGVAVTGINAALSGCGTIYGRVDGDGTPLLSAFVQAHFWVPARQEWQWYPLELQDVDPLSGEYSLERVRVGQWTMYFGDHGGVAGTYAGEYHGGAHFVRDAQTLLVTPGSSVFAKGDLDLGGTLRGHVYDSSGAPVESVNVVLHDWDPVRQSWGWSGMVTPTMADGSYAISGLDTWMYRLQFFPPEGSPLASEYWKNSADTGGAVDLTWAIGQIREGYDAWLGIDEAVPPITTLSGLPASGWSRLPLDLTLTAGDTGSGVESTEYRLDGGAWVNGTTIVVPAPATHTGDGLHTIEYRSADYRGNMEPAHRDEVRIDTLGPTTSALGRVSVRKGGRASFVYRVDDRSPSATVAIRILRGARLVKRLDVGPRATGRVLTHRWRCTLRQGRYTWEVLATDAAGNTQLKTGSRTLVVN